MCETEGASFCNNIREEQRRRQVCKIYAIVHGDLQWTTTCGLFQDVNWFIPDINKILAF